MAKIANYMTRVVAIGTLKEYEVQTTPFTMGKGVITLENNAQVRFTIFNGKPDSQNPHTKADDFDRSFYEGDKVFITGQDNRNYSEQKDNYYEDVNVWDFRAAGEDETSRWVYVYIGDLEMHKEQLCLKHINYKDDVMHFQLDDSELNLLADYEIGSRVKIKGEIFSGMKMDYYGDGDFVTERLVKHAELLNTPEEIEADAAEDEADPGDEAWD